MSMALYDCSIDEIEKILEELSDKSGIDLETIKKDIYPGEIAEIAIIDDLYCSDSKNKGKVRNKGKNRKFKLIKKNY